MKDFMCDLLVMFVVCALLNLLVKDWQVMAFSGVCALLLFRVVTRIAYGRWFI